MQITKRFGALIATLIFIATTLCVAFGIASTTLADETEGTPMIYCEYTDAEGNPVDGNALVAGTYDVSFMVKGFSTISVIEITAAYDTEVVTVNGITASIDSMESMGSVTANGNFVVGYVSTGDYVTVDSSAQLIATASMTFAPVEGEDTIDAADYITANTNPNYTFVVASTAGGNYADEYALVDTFEGYEGSLSLMTCDITPEFVADGFDISGQIQIADDINGHASGYGLVGITVDVIDGGDVIATAVTDSDGNYTLAGVPAGTYTVSISGPTTIDREVTLVVDGAKTVDAVGIVMADYNKDGFVTGPDLGLYLSSHGVADNYNVYCDYNCDGFVTGPDLGLYLVFHGQTIVYNDVTI